MCFSSKIVYTKNEVEQGKRDCHVEGCICWACRTSMEELVLCCFLRGHYEEVTKKVKPEEDSGQEIRSAGAAQTLETHPLVLRRSFAFGESLQNTGVVYNSSKMISPPSYGWCLVSR